MFYPIACVVALLLSSEVKASLNNVQQVMSDIHASFLACQHLSIGFPNQTIHASGPQYQQQQDSYWSFQQCQLQPACHFLPSSSQDVRESLRILAFLDVSFAISSGGHSSNIGASNIENGVTIDLSSLNEVSVTNDDEAAWIGPGARWSDVYTALEPHGLTVAGARVSHVGVGGFVLGGGLSLFASQMGWSCDTVLEFEVVTPDLRILNVDQQRNEDLFWALKGSLGAFGIVTRIKMRTIKVPELGIYAGAMTFEEGQMEEVFATLAKTALDSESDLSSYVSVGYLALQKEFGYSAFIANTAGQNSTSSLDKWQSVPKIYSSLRHTSVPDSAKEIGESNPLGLRRSKFTLTTVPNLEVMLPLLDLFRKFATSLSLGPNGLLGMNYQPLTRPMLRIGASQSNPNIFSETLATEMMPLLLVSVELWWDDSSQDTELEGLMKALESEMLGPNGVDWAKHPWVYPNYAARWQEPLEDWRLGEQTRKRLSRVRKTYDPDDIWRRLVPGLWHV